MPTLYPVKVTQAYGVNTEYDWTSLLHQFSLFMDLSSFEKTRKTFPTYDGFGLPIGTYAMNTRGDQITPIKLPPDEIYLYWVSLVNTKFFVTKYILDRDVKDLMSKPDKFRDARSTVLDGSCYRTEFVFGLLPNGYAKVYLRGCGEVVYITDLASDRVLEHDSNGFTAENYKSGSLVDRAKRRSEDEGVSIDPIPWEKVNKIYAKEPIISLEQALSR